MLDKSAEQLPSPNGHAISEDLYFFPEELDFACRIEASEISRMEQQSLRFVVTLTEERGPRNLVPVHRIEHRQEANVFSLGAQLLCHLVCDRPTQAIATDKVRAARLYSPDFRY